MPSPPIPDEPEADASLPLTMSASVVLSALPVDAQTALAKEDDMEGVKGQLRAFASTRTFRRLPYPFRHCVNNASEIIGTSYSYCRYMICFLRLPHAL